MSIKCKGRRKWMQEALAEQAPVGNEWHVSGPAAPHGRYMSKSAELTERGDRQGLADPAVLLPLPLTLSDCRLISTAFNTKCNLSLALFLSPARLKPRFAIKK